MNFSTIAVMLRSRQPGRGRDPQRAAGRNCHRLPQRFAADLSPDWALTSQSYREDRSPLTASGWTSTGIPGLEMSAGRCCPVALRGDSRLRLTTFAKCLDILRAVKSAPNTKRITGPNVVVDACPTKYSPGTDDSKFADSRGVFPIRCSRSKIAELRNGRRCTSAL
jgi:hypothetical protein